MEGHVAVTVGGRPGRMRSFVEQMVESIDLEPIDLTRVDHVVRVAVLVDPPVWSADSEPGDRFIIVRSMVDDEQLLDDLVRGADAVLGPVDVTMELFTAVQAVASGGSWLSPDLTRTLILAVRAQRDSGPVGRDDFVVQAGGDRPGLGRVRQEEEVASGPVARRPLGRGRR